MDEDKMVVGIANDAGLGAGDGRGWRGEGAGRSAGGPGRRRNRGARGGRQDTVLYAQAAIDPSAAVRIVCCVDDTDDVSGDTSTGYVAEQIACCVADLGGRVELGVTRHQLLLADGVPYTSHNSAMCFTAFVPRDAVSLLRDCAVRAIKRHSAAEADPGLCIAVLPDAGASDEGGVGAVAADAVMPAAGGTGAIPSDASASGVVAPGASTSGTADVLFPDEARRQVEALCAFGRRAQEVVCTKDEAYELARSIPWVHLSEHGGTGQGVIGALAGVGLRLSGDDGRFRGKWNLARILEGPREGRSALPAVEFCALMSGLAGGAVLVVDERGVSVASDVLVELVGEAKPVLHDGSLTFVVDMRGGVAYPAEKVDLGTIGNSTVWRRACARFAFDNDQEECTPTLARACCNCLYRRWTARGFACVANNMA